MRIAKLLAIVLGLAIAAIGVFGVAAPSALLEFGRLLQTTDALYLVATVRVMFGAVLLWVAPSSRTPKVLRVLGILIIIAGIVTPIFGIERSGAMFEWWSSQGALFTRAWAILAVAFGLFIAYAVLSPRRSAAQPRVRADPPVRSFYFRATVGAGRST